MLKKSDRLNGDLRTVIGTKVLSMLSGKNWNSQTREATFWVIVNIPNQFKLLERLFILKS